MKTDHHRVGRAPRDLGSTSEVDWYARPVHLRDDVTLLVGANDQPMLFCASTRSYVRLSKSAVTVVHELDGRSGHEVTSTVCGARQESVAAVHRLLSELRSAGVLTVAPEPPVGRQRLLSAVLPRHPRRLRLTGPMRGALEPPAALLRRVPRRAAVSAVTGLALVAGALIFEALGTQAAIAPYRALWVVALVLTVQTVAHEAAHAVVCQALGVPIREAGIKLWCLVLPVAYVDRTDGYRIRGRGGRVAIALAGPWVDLCAAGLSSIVVLISGGAALAHTLLLTQLGLLLINLNPLFPTDGHHAVEAALGEMNLRRRAFSYLVHRMLGSPLPSTLAGLVPRRRFAYAAYGVVSLSYAVLVLTGLVASLSQLFGWTS